MGKPAARIGDMHTCNLATPEPHEGGMIAGPGCITVMIGGLPAAVTGDMCICNGPANTVASGSSTVRIGGKPAARKGDATAHGGKIVTGCRTVLIGGMTFVNTITAAGAFDQAVTDALLNTDLPDPVPSSEIKEKSVVCTKVLQKVRALLRKKLKLLEGNDPKTLELFRKWFLNDDEETKQVIITRIQNALTIIADMTPGNFIGAPPERQKLGDVAWVDTTDNTHSIFVTDVFWKWGLSGKRSKVAVTIHELSHFRDIGNTKDYAYDKKCYKLKPHRALYNADSFAFFILGTGAV